MIKEKLIDAIGVDCNHLLHYWGFEFSCGLLWAEPASLGVTRDEIRRMSIGFFMALRITLFTKLCAKALILELHLGPQCG